jgi:hypothetical protein
MKQLAHNESPTIHIKVTVQKDGNNYQATYDPEIIEVNEPDTILHFKLVSPTPDDVVIRSVSISPESQDQLSTPSISKNGKSMTLSDLNTVRQTFNLSFVYRDKHSDNVKVCGPNDGPVEFPEITNNPPELQLMAMAMENEPINNPVGL